MVMKEIVDFDQSRRDIEVNYIANKKYLATQIGLCTFKLIGDPIKKDGGLMRSMEFYYDRAGYGFEPFTTRMPMFMNAVRDAITHYEMMRRYYEGTDGSKGYVQQLLDLSHKMQDFMEETIKNEDFFRQELERRDAVVKELNAKIDEIRESKFDEQAYVDFLVGQYCELKNMQIQDVMKVFFSGSTAKNNLLRAISNSRLLKEYDIYFDKLKGVYKERTGKDIEVFSESASLPDMSKDGLDEGPG